MKQYGIMMTAHSVRGLLREVEAPGTGKTQSRRSAWKTFLPAEDTKSGRAVVMPTLWQKVSVGDRLWVRERLFATPERGIWHYDADNEMIELPAGDPRVAGMLAWAHHKEDEVCSARHMPKWASRLTLIVTATKIERLQDISEADAIAEGVERVDDPRGVAWKSYETYPDGTDHPHNVMPMRSPIFSYQQIWHTLHGKRSWDANPVVVALTFRPILAHIDAPEARAAA